MLIPKLCQNCIALYVLGSVQVNTNYIFLNLYIFLAWVNMK